MPIYNARGISVRLGTLPLSDSVTHNIVARKGETARQQRIEAEKKLLTSKRLPEKAVRFPEDHASFELNWLGNAPFKQAHVTPPRQNTKDGTPCDRGEQPLEDTRGEALVLHVQLSEKTFMSGLDRLKTNIKIDVFFNGELASCVFIPLHDIRSGTKSCHQVFAGTRVDYLAERPWVIFPTTVLSKDASNCGKVTLPAEVRWQAICRALRCEAQERGTDVGGTMPPSAEFLKALSYIQMPQELRDLHRPSCRSFGVIDVVISAGDGKKVTSGSGYLNRPQRLVDDRFSLVVNENQYGSESQGSGVNATDQDFDDIDAEGESDCDYEPRSKKQNLLSSVLLHHPVPDATSVGKLIPTGWLSPNILQDATSVRQQLLSPTSISNKSFSTGYYSSPQQNPSPDLHKPLLDSSPPVPTGYNIEPYSVNGPYGIHTASGECNMKFPYNPIGNGHGTAPVAPMYPWFTPAMPNMLFHPPNTSTQYSSAYLPRHSFPPPCRYVHPALLPPTGLFSVTQKPKARIGSIQPQSTNNQQNKSCDTTLVSRIVIYDQSGPIVDHRWDTAQSLPQSPKSCSVSGLSSEPVETNSNTEVSRCTPSCHDALGVQGPKPTSVLFEDPEEILRETIELGRSGSTNKKDFEKHPGQEAVVSSHTHDCRMLETASSSSLSSAPESPDQETFYQQIKKDIPQLDGPSSGRITVHSNSICHTPPPSSSLSSANPRLETSLTTSPSLNPKKRKALVVDSKPVARKWRNNNRIVTASDPPLNQNCVITYAEGDAADPTDPGPLRQVRGERQGIFREEYVVFAARLLVPGTQMGQMDG